MLAVNEILESALRLDPQDRATLAERLLASLSFSSPEIAAGILALNKRTDPVLAELWDNPRDAAYDKS
jgi:hypothetical protein